MATKSLTLLTMGVVCVFSAGWAVADCPSADVTGDCFVDFEDLAVIGANWPNVYDWNDVNTLAEQWLTTDPCVPGDMVYIPDGEFQMGDHHGDGLESFELPVHFVYIDPFFMSKFEITNQQYCDYLNSAHDVCDIKVGGGIVYASSDDSNSYPYCNTHSYDADSQIDYNDVSGTFSVRTKGEPPRDMSDDPMVCVSWYGSAAYCNWRSGEEGYEACYNLTTWDCNFSKHGCRLPTEAEWEYGARGGLSGKRFPWSDPNITHSQANYLSYWEEGSPYWPYDANPTEGVHPDWEDGISPCTSPAGSFSRNGYGLYDMAGNAFEWCNDWYDGTYYDTSPYDNPTGPPTGGNRVLRSGGWNLPTSAYNCRVASRCNQHPDNRRSELGFRIVVDLE